MRKFNCILLILFICYSFLSILVLVRILQDYPLLYHTKGKWKLVWSDEFNGATLDQTKWEMGTCSHGGITVKNGYLMLSSSTIKTAEKFTWKYGRFEIRAKLLMKGNLLSYISLHSVDRKFVQEIFTRMALKVDSYTIFMNNNW